MSDVFLIKRSSVALKVPTTAQMAVGELAINTYDGKLYLRGNNGSDFVAQVGANSAFTHPFSSTWKSVAGLGPVEKNEYDELSLLFSKGMLQAITMWVRVPPLYTTGNPIKMKVSHYTPGVANVFKFTATTTLVRQGVDSVASTTNTYTSTNGDQTINATANAHTDVLYDLTTAGGLINSINVNANDMLKIVLQRVTPTGTDDTNDVRVLPGMTEITYQ